MRIVLDEGKTMIRRSGMSWRTQHGLFARFLDWLKSAWWPKIHYIGHL